mmetsp:Transcript_20921/g.25379  ORF Transcript_20921/g.25379 Transcript_20921/m.25379 type:complete len:141 (+) Transcript_20921:240-662(+)
MNDFRNPNENAVTSVTINQSVGNNYGNHNFQQLKAANPATTSNFQRRNSRCVVSCCIALAIPIFIIGVSLWSVGKSKLEQALAMNPDTDFINLGESCDVIEVVHTPYDISKTRTESYKCGQSTCHRDVTTTYCMDEYYYR